jgi:hypothetical protein
MPKLNDYFESDIQTFINQDEFATLLVIDGKEVSVVSDNDLLKKYNSKNDEEGLAVGELLFHAKKSDFEEELFIGKTMKLNKDIYRISDLQESAGMYTVTLVGYRS